MPKKISKSQFAQLWHDEFVSEQTIRGRCILCGNSGKIDTRGKVFDARGEDCGGEALCICLNGRRIKELYDAEVRREQRLAKEEREDAALLERIAKTVRV